VAHSGEFVDPPVRTLSPHQATRDDTQIWIGLGLLHVVLCLDRDDLALFDGGQAVADVEGHGEIPAVIAGDAAVNRAIEDDTVGEASVGRQPGVLPVEVEGSEEQPRLGVAA